MQEQPPYPAVQCPTCHRWHSAALEPGETTTILCDCSKLLKIEKAQEGNTLVVREQIPSLVAHDPDVKE